MVGAFKNRKNALFLVLGITVIFGYFVFENLGARAQEQIKIFPSSFSGDPSDSLGTSWQNPQAVFLQDLGENAEFQEFNEENSTYPFASKLTSFDDVRFGLLERIRNFFKSGFAQAEEPSPTPTPEVTSTPTPTPEPTSTPTPEATPSPSPTPEPSPTPTPTPESTPTPTPTPESTPTPEPTPTPTIEPTPTPEATPEPPLDKEHLTGQATPTPESTPTPTSEATPEPSPTSTPEPTIEPTPTVEPTTTPEPLPNFIEQNLGGQATPTPASTPEATPAPTPEPQAIKKVLVLSDFSIAEDFSENKIENVQLRFSLTGRGEAGDKLTIEYYYSDSWKNLAEFDLENEISNSLNGGYFLYGLPVFENWQDLENLKIRFTYQSNQQPTTYNQQLVYLDAVWLETEYEEGDEEIKEETAEEEIEENENQSSEGFFENIVEFFENAINIIKKESAPTIKKTEIRRGKELKIFDKFSRHSCSVNPFFKKIKRRETANYTIFLQPSYENSLFKIELGDLPLGVEATLGQTEGRGSSQISLEFKTSENSQVGSLGLVVIYQEKQKGGGFLTNFCQLALAIKE